MAAALANNRGTGTSAHGHVDEDRVTVLEAAVDAVGSTDSSERARLLAILGGELTFAVDRNRSSTCLTDALAMARRLNDPLCFLQVTAIVYTVDFLPHTVGDRLSDLTRAVALAESLGDPRASFYAHRNRAIACLQAADRAGLDAHLDAAAAMAERIGEPYELWTSMTLQSMLSDLSGDLDRSLPPRPRQPCRSGTVCPKPWPSTPLN